MDDKLKDEIRKFALDNARKYNGQANVGSVIGKILSEKPELKSELKELSPFIREICAQVSKMSVEKQVKELEETAPELLVEKKVVEKRELKHLPDAEQGKVVLRLAPSPSGPNHIGHAVVYVLNYLYSKKYEGRLLLRIEDTNPENIYEPAYRMIEEDWNWLTKNSIHNLVIQSSRMETYYDYCHKLLVEGNAYVCTCNPDVFRNFSLKKSPCKCRGLEKEENLLRWDKMFIEYEPGQAVVRMKTDITHKNPAMRDFALFRINHAVHPKTGTKYKVWPLMNFAVAVDDHDFNVTHTIRGKDHMDNAKRQQFLYDAFGWKAPSHVFVGKINFTGMKVKTSTTKQEIIRGAYSGWDDPRLPFLAALRRRGFQPGAFHEFAKDIGLGENDKTVPIEDFFKSLESHNRKIIDPVANRYFFVPEPVKINIQNAPEKSVSVPLHPDYKEKGSRKLDAKYNFLIPKADYLKLEEGRLYRLMDYCNFRKEKGNYVFDSVELEKYRKQGASTMQWIPYQDALDCQVRMPDNSLKIGKCEPALKDAKVGDMVQLERFGFCRVDKKEGKIVLWFAHK